MNMEHISRMERSKEFWENFYHSKNDVLEYYFNLMNYPVSKSYFYPPPNLIITISYHSSNF